MFVYIISQSLHSFLVLFARNTKIQSWRTYTLTVLNMLLATFLRPDPLRPQWLVHDVSDGLLTITAARCDAAKIPPCDFVDAVDSRDMTMNSVGLVLLW